MTTAIPTMHFDARRCTSRRSTNYARRVIVATIQFVGFLFVVSMFSTSALGQIVFETGGEAPLPTDSPMPAEERTLLMEHLEHVADSLRQAGRLPEIDTRENTELLFPLRQADSFSLPGFFGISNFVDQDPAFPNQLLDYNCGQRTYDLPNGYNHRGIDYFTWPFGWTMMDDDAVEIVSAAEGVILHKSDGHFDRQCTFNNNPWNAVYVTHTDGSIAWYGHMKKNSLTPKNVGDPVQAGEYLGIVGSSGSSTGPHLHFEVYAPGQTLVDPYAGKCNAMNEDSWWAEQPAYYTSRINAVMTHSAIPTFPSCPDTEEQINAADQFEYLDTVFMAFYFQDQLQGQQTQYRILRPNGSVWQQWAHASSASHFAASWWVWSTVIPDQAPQGTYTLEATYLGETYTHHFSVGTAVSTGPDAPDELRSMDVFPNPAAGAMTITIASPTAEYVRVTLLDLLGREVTVVYDDTVESGRTDVRVDLSGLAPGVYIVRATGGSEAINRRLTVMR